MISLIVPTLGRPSLKRLLDSIDRAIERDGLKRDEDIEIIVSHDSDGSGVNRARNEGARKSHGEILWFLDDDTELPSTCRLRDLPLIFGNTSTIAAGGLYFSKEDATWMDRGYNAFCSAWRASAGEKNREQLLGGTLAVRKSTWLLVGGFDESIRYGGSETSFINMLRQMTVEDRDLRIEFRDELNVLHAAGPRAVSRWIQIARQQGSRKTVSFLPHPMRRVLKVLSFVRQQNFMTTMALTIFSIPFLSVSLFSQLTRYRD